MPAEAERAQDSGDETEVFKKLGLRLAALSQEMERIGAERRSLAFRSTKVQHEIAEVQAKRNAFRNKSLPLLNLPTEVTCAIFYYVSTDPLSIYGKQYLQDGSQLPGEVVVSLVCQRWRAIALAYSQIWSRFRFYGKELTLNLVDRLEAYTERSGTQLLDLWFRLESRQEMRLGVEENKIAEKVWGLATKHLSRWKRITVIDGQGSFFLDSMISAGLENAFAPNLESLATSSPFKRHRAYEGASLAPTIFKQGAPRLKHVLCDDSAHLCQPPLENLTTLRVEIGELEDVDAFPFSGLAFLALLELPSLENFSVSGVFFRGSHVHDERIVTVKSLKHLRCDLHEDLIQMLPFIRAPNLETLTLQHIGFRDEFDSHASACLEEPPVFPALRSLSLNFTSAPRTDAGLQYFAKMTSSITDITFVARRYEDNIFSGIMHSPNINPNWFWTKLKRITFNVAKLDKHFDDVSRFIAGRPDKGLVLRIPDYFNSTQQVELARFSTLELYSSRNPRSIHERWPPGDHDIYLDPLPDRDPFYVRQVDSSQTYPPSKRSVGWKAPERLVYTYLTQNPDCGIVFLPPDFTVAFETEVMLAGAQQAQSGSSGFDAEMSKKLELRASALSQEKARIEADQKSLALRLTEVQHEIDEIQAKRNALTNNGIPVLTLPTEITCAIFSHALEYPYPLFRQREELGGRAPGEVVISHVCQRWRSIALGYSQIWSRFCYDVKEISLHPVDRLRAYMERSGTQALELCFRLERRGPPLTVREGRITNKLLQLATEHVSRWQRITVLTGDNSFDIMNSILEHAFPTNLECFAAKSAFSDGADYIEGSDRAPTIFKHGAPKLTHVVLNGDVALLCRPPLDNITTLQVEVEVSFDTFPFSWSDFQSLLEMPHLENLSVAGVFLQAPPLRDFRIITMKNLRHVRCSMNEDLKVGIPLTFNGHLSGFMGEEEPYTFPVLRSLSLAFCFSANSQDLHYFTKMTGAVTEMTIVAQEYDNEILWEVMHNAHLDPDMCWTKLKRITLNMEDYPRNLDDIVSPSGLDHPGRQRTTAMAGSSDKDSHMSSLLDRRRLIEEEKSNLALQMRQLDHRITEIQAEYGNIYNKKIPALKLPAEITGMIFYYASSYPKENDGGRRKHLLREVVVSHVCTQWRMIALKNPRLWCSFCFDGPVSKRFPLDRFEAYMERSANLDLELWLDFSGAGASGPWNQTHAFALVQKAWVHLPRWNRVTIKTDGDIPLHTLIPLITQSHAPRLDHFGFYRYITQQYDGSTIQDLAPVIFLGGAPYLRSVMLDSTAFVVARPPLSYVTTLRIEANESDVDLTIPWSTFLQILGLPFLTNLSVSGNFFDATEVQTIEVISMPNLKHFRFRESESLSILLPFIKAPLLESLQIHDIWFPEEYNTLKPEPDEFPALQSLYLHCASFSSPHTAWYFARMTKKVTDILLSDDDYSTTALSVLLHGPHFKKKFWPKLKTLALNIYIREEEEVNDIVRFAEARGKDGFTLRLLDSMYNDWEDDYFPQCEDLARACEVDVVDSEDRNIWQRQWPPGVFNPDHLCEDDDPFDIPPQQLDYSS
ncbi:hypothetical protein CVT26_012247 [Gymnopilus dilepis]|uniref:F-box domain-containing protein n=1 Tax=Gymnopilus dilepis TaxID=231916 RepID=A0A409YQ84_9AGAR|nr:hypothetical protein CVT26_012247 [Gymnopilus dilepis]